MIRDLHSYPSYKPSGVEWLGDVPEHWEVRRLKHVCSRFALIRRRYLCSTDAAPTVALAIPGGALRNREFAERGEDGISVCEYGRNDKTPKGLPHGVWR